MTDDMMNLRTPWRRPLTPICLREMISFAAQRLMELESRRPDRGGPRREEPRAPCPTQRLTRPSLGDPGRYGRASHPKLRKGSYFPGFLEPRCMAEKALTAVVQCLKLIIRRTATEEFASLRLWVLGG